MSSPSSILSRCPDHLRELHFMTTITITQQIIHSPLLNISNLPYTLSLFSLIQVTAWILDLWCLSMSMSHRCMLLLESLCRPEVPYFASMCNCPCMCLKYSTTFLPYRALACLFFSTFILAQDTAKIFTHLLLTVHSTFFNVLFLSLNSHSVLICKIDSYSFSSQVPSSCFTFFNSSSTNRTEFLFSFLYIIFTDSSIMSFTKRTVTSFHFEHLNILSTL